MEVTSDTHFHYSMEGPQQVTDDPVSRHQTKGKRRKAEGVKTSRRTEGVVKSKGKGKQKTTQMATQSSSELSVQSSSGATVQSAAGNCKTSIKR